MRGGLLEGGSLEEGLIERGAYLFIQKTNDGDISLQIAINSKSLHSIYHITNYFTCF